MKRLLFYAVITVYFSLVSAETLFEFKSYKDRNNFLEENFLKTLSDLFHPDIFFETGTYLAQTTKRAAPYFREVHTVELHPELFRKAKIELAFYENVTVYLGKSSETIAQIAPQLKGTILFWLDAHYSGEGTATSSDKKNDPNAFTAIRDELQAIKKLKREDVIILIDDIRGFGTTINDQVFLGCWCYPTLQEVVHDLLDINPRYTVALVGDILFAYDSTLYDPKFSQTVHACTKTRLYDGHNLSNNELSAFEQIIMHAPEPEKEFIQQLYKMTVAYEDPLFWHDVWYGLIQLGSENFAEANFAFSRVDKKIRAITKDTDINSFFNHHWHIDTYLPKNLIT